MVEQQVSKVQEELRHQRNFSYVKSTGQQTSKASLMNGYGYDSVGNGSGSLANLNMLAFDSKRTSFQETEKHPSTLNYKIQEQKSEKLVMDQQLQDKLNEKYAKLEEKLILQNLSSKNYRTSSLETGNETQIASQPKHIRNLSQQNDMSFGIIPIYNNIEKDQNLEKQIDKQRAMKNNEQYQDFNNKEQFQFDRNNQPQFNSPQPQRKLKALHHYNNNPGSQSIDRDQQNRQNRINPIQYNDPAMSTSKPMHTNNYLNFQNTFDSLDKNNPVFYKYSNSPPSNISTKAHMNLNVSQDNTTQNEESTYNNSPTHQQFQSPNQKNSNINTYYSQMPKPVQDTNKYFTHKNDYSQDRHKKINPQFAEQANNIQKSYYRSPKFIGQQQRQQPNNNNQKLIMNTYLTPIVFISKDYHLPLNINDQQQQQMFIDSDFDEITKNQMTLGNYRQLIDKVNQSRMQMAGSNSYQQLLQNQQILPAGVGMGGGHNRNRSMNDSLVNNTIKKNQNNILINQSDSPTQSIKKSNQKNQPRNHDLYQKQVFKQFQQMIDPIKNSSPNQGNQNSKTNLEQLQYDNQDINNSSQAAFDTIQNQYMVEEIPLSLDYEIKQICHSLELYLKTGNYKLDQTIRKLRLKHPIFKLISQNAFNYIIENSFLFKLRANQGAYKQGVKALKNIYFVLYGQFSLRNFQNGNYNENMIVGHTLGEEVVFDQAQPLFRYESCIASEDEDGGLLQINADIIHQMKDYKQKLGGGTSLRKDYQILMGVLNQNYQIKQQWRDGWRQT
eukprot:403332185